jgi:hypothetical protein
MSEQEVKPTRRLVGCFEELAGKTVARVGYGGQFFWVVFTDGTYVFLDAHSYSMHYERNIDDVWQAEIGLISKVEYRQKREAHERQCAAHREKREREHLASLLLKYPDAVANN